MCVNNVIVVNIEQMLTLDILMLLDGTHNHLNMFDVLFR